MASKSIGARRHDTARMIERYGRETVVDVLTAAGYDRGVIDNIIRPTPQEPDGEFRVIAFCGYGIYHYAAIRIKGRWYVTQDATSFGAFPSLTWSQLIDKFGVQFIETLVVLS